MQKKRSIKIISVVLILMLICVSITYVKSGNKEVLATTKEFNSENLQDNEHMHVEVDSTEDKVPVPNGYVGSKATGENEIDTGYVIYEGTEEVNDSNVEEAQKTRNQYVWIPVPDASTMYGTDANGKKWGKLYDFTTETGDDIDPVTGAKPLNWSEKSGIIQLASKINIEPEITNYDSDFRTKSFDIKTDNLNEFLIHLEQQFNSMIESIEKYGGFYIGRYETGDLSKNVAVIKKYTTNLGAQPWHVMYKKCKNLKGKNNNVETGMIWGNQWDRTLIWLIESENKTVEEISEDSINWGNYSNSTFNYKNSSGKLVTKNAGSVAIIPTGSSEYTKANNIYDLAGNVREWSIETYWNGRTSRGGCTTYSSDSQPSNHRYGETMASYGDLRLPCNVIHKIGQNMYIMGIYKNDKKF